MASLSYGLCFQYSSSALRPAGVRGLRRDAGPYDNKSELLWHPRAVTPRTKAGEVKEEKTIIREKLLNVEPAAAMQASSYDTAWVAMVPAPAVSPRASRFPQCVDWIMQNQRVDGSWGLDDHPSLAKDALSSTLACVLALKTWGVGEEHVRKGLSFIGHSYSSSVTDDQCAMPVGFNVIFPGMLASCIALGTEVPLTHDDIDGIFRLRHKELQSLASAGSRAFSAYIAEGLGNLLDWDEAMAAYQRKNGSFFNSPATTAAAAIHGRSGRRALEYLDSLVSISSSVPTVYPRNFYSRLRMVDTLEKMGISRSFSYEINHILHMTYISWLAKDEEIMLDMTTCAIAFRLLRMHGYDVSTDGLAQFSEESSFHDSVQGTLNDTEALLQLHKASQVQILDEEMVLENIGSWSAKLLRQQLSSPTTNRTMSGTTVDPTEVEHVLKYPFYATLDPLEHRRNIANFKTAGIQMLKSAYRACLPDEEIVSLAADVFRSSQTVYQQELRYLESWVKVVRLEELEFARVMPPICLFPPASTVFPCELSEARIAFSKNSILVSIVDDLFDVAGSREEMENLVKLIEMWDAHEQVGFCSERVEIVFRAIYDTSNQLGAEAAAVVDHHRGAIVNHPAQLQWANTVRAMMTEANWTTRGHVPSFEEYMAVGQLSFGLGPMLLTSLSFVIGRSSHLPEEVINSQEYSELFRHMNVCGRLLNDLQSYDREKKQQKINSVLLLARDRSIEAAKSDVRSAIEASRIQLLRSVLKNDSAVPCACRQVFWNMCKVVHHFYHEMDLCASPRDMMHAGNMLLFQPCRSQTKNVSTATSHVRE